MGKAAESPISLNEAEIIIQQLARVFLEANSKSTNDDIQTPSHDQRPLPQIEVRYRTLIEQIPAVTFMISLDGGIGEAYVSPHIEAALGFSQKEWLDDPIRWYRQIHPDDKARWNIEAAQMVLSGEPLRSVYRISARDGHTVWFHCEVKMVRRDSGRPWFVHGIAFDITELKQAEEALRKAHDELELTIADRTAELAKANSELQIEIAERRRVQEQLVRTHAELEIRVSERTTELAHANKILQAEMIERRRLEKALLEIGERETQRIGQDLHDSLGQNLTGIAFMCKALERKLADQSLAETADAARIAVLVNQTISQTRELARGLLPVQPGDEGLMSAIRHWASEVEEMFKISCHFECDPAVAIGSMTTAAHLYRIAQEAVHNAIKHGKAQHIIIRFCRSREGRVALSVEDDGIGFAEKMENKRGMGLRIMNYRANMIGATLDISKNRPGGATVSCFLPMKKQDNVRAESWKRN